MAGPTSIRTRCWRKDGVHPSTAGHRLIAGAAAGAVNEHYDTEIVLPEAP